MTMQKIIQKLYRQRPFRPFTIRMAGGCEFCVEQPERICWSLDGGTMVIHGDHGMAIIAGEHIVEVIQR